MSTTILNSGAGAQPRSNILGTDGFYQSFVPGFFDIAGALITPVAFDPTAIASVRIFGFLSDPSATSFALSVWDTSQSTVTDDNTDDHVDIVPGFTDLDEIIQVNNPVAVAAWTMFASNSGGGNIYRELLGVTTTNTLPVAGRALTMSVTDKGLLDDMAAVIPVLSFPHVEVSGRASTAARQGLLTTPLTALIPETDYTAAIAAAGNTFTDGAANVWRIMGLYETVALPG